MNKFFKQSGIEDLESQLAISMLAFVANVLVHTHY